MADEQPSLREAYRDDLEFAAAPLRADRIENYQAALKFADSGIRSLFVLNGGGLVALPAFLALFKIEVRIAAVWVLLGGALFVLGLITSALTTLLSYWSAMAAMESMYLQLTNSGALYARTYGQVPTPATDEEIASTDRDAQRLERTSIRLRTWAVIAAIVSLAAFVGGTTVSGVVLSLYLDRQPQGLAL